jgi:arginyl-tRNA synthetase
VAEKLDAADFSMIDAVMPGFINLKLSDTFLQNYPEEMTFSSTAKSFPVMPLPLPEV